MSSRRLDQDEYICLNYTSSEDVFKTSWSRAIYLFWPYVFKTFSRRLEDTLPRRLQEVFKTSSRRLGKTSSRHLQDVSNTYHQFKLLLLASLLDVFNTFLRRTSKRIIYRRIFLGHNSEKFIVSVQNLQER